MKKRLALIFTGGTISMKFDPAIGAAVPALSGQEILNLAQGADEVANVEVIEFGRYPGPHMTLPQMMALASLLRATLDRPDIVGVVIVHDTATLEETAYLLGLSTENNKDVAQLGVV